VGKAVIKSMSHCATPGRPKTAVRTAITAELNIVTVVAVGAIGKRNSETQREKLSYREA
jgi:hypothetical protein